MATDLRLSVGDGDVTDDVALDGVSGFGVDNGTFSAPAPRAGERYRVVSWRETIKGASADDLWVKLGSLQTKLNQASSAAGPYGHGTNVTLSMKLGDATNYVYADIVGGVVDVPAETFTGHHIAADWLQSVYVELVCLPYFRGAAVTTTVSGTITNTLGTYAVPGGAGAGGLFIANVPGDVPALARYVLTDTTGSSKVINRLRISSMWMPDPASSIVQSDFVPWIEEAIAGAGSATSDATASGSAGAQITQSTAMQRAASWAKTTPALATGLYDVYLRTKDSNTILGAPSLDEIAVDNDANMYVRQTITTVSAAGTTLSPTWGKGTRAGSTLLMAVALKSRTITITTPTGWTASTAAVAHATGTMRVAWFYITASASRSGVETVTVSSSVSVSAFMFEVVGAAYTTPIDIQVTGSGNTTSLAIASGTLAQAREMIFGVGQHVATSWDAAAITSGFTDTTIVYQNNTQDAAVGYARSTVTTTLNMVFEPNGVSDVVGAIISVKQQPNLAPAIPVGTYDVCIVAAGVAGASLSPASNVMSVAVTQTDCVIAGGWTLGTGTADHHRMYYRITGGVWEYYAQPAASGTYNAYIIADDAGTVGDPPTVNSNASNVRIAVALLSGTTVYNTRPVQTVVGGSKWEMLYCGTVPLPPMPAIDGSTPRGWILYAESSHPSPAGTIDFDLCILAPHQWANSSYVEAKYTGLNLATLRAWKIETRRDGLTFGYLAATGGDTEAGQLDVVGDCYLGPGDSWITVIADIASGEHDIVDTDYTLTCTYVPRFTYLRGA